MKNSDFLIKLKLEGKIELTDPSIEISKSYNIKSNNCLRSAKILFAEKLYENSVSEAYYSMYNSVLSLLFKCGIKCENHSAAIILLNLIFQLNELNKKLYNAKKERIDKQYYLIDSAEEITKESAQQMISDAEMFILDISDYIDKLKASDIEKARKKFGEI
jgi:uncharacterized protein (UPF0332 family)